MTQRDCSSRECLFHDEATNVGQAEVSSLKLVSKLGVLDSEAMQDSGLQVVGVDRIFENVVAIIVGLADGEAALDSPACEPDRKTARVMVAAIVGSGEFPLAIYGSAKFTRPND